MPGCLVRNRLCLIKAHMCLDTEVDKSQQSCLYGCTIGLDSAKHFGEAETLDFHVMYMDFIIPSI